MKSSSRPRPDRSTNPSPNLGLILSESPERVRLRELSSLLEKRRDQISERELELETLQAELYTFEKLFQAKLRNEHHELNRVTGYVRHIERWLDLLREPATKQSLRRAKKLNQRRQSEVEEDVEDHRQTRRTATLDEPLSTDTEPAAVDQTLKQVYRALARRFHPDLARSEDERVRLGALMAKINDLYQRQDLTKLLELLERAKGGEVDIADADIDEQLSSLEERLRWFDRVLGNLAAERIAMERSPTCALWRSWQQAELIGRDFFTEMRVELDQRITDSYQEIKKAIRLLERTVTQFNQRHTLKTVGKKTAKQQLERFDPFADKSIIRLGLDNLAALTFSPAAKHLATELSTRIESEPATLLLLLLTYVSELSPFPLPGLESYEDLTTRFGFLCEAADAPDDGEPIIDISLERALIGAEDILEYGARLATPTLAFTGLRFRQRDSKDAVHLLLRQLVVRRQFRRVLSVVGKLEACAHCEGEVFTVPLFRTRGIDNLRALVCPNCATTLSSYWLPKGEDVQTVLNDAYLDLDMVVEWSFLLGRASIALQLLPAEVESQTTGMLRQRLFDEVFKRYDIAVELGHIELLQKGAPVKNKVRLDDLNDRQFDVRFSSAAEMSVADALEIVRHRVRTKFSPDGA